MFCSQCGIEATGNYCWKCGAPLHQTGPEGGLSPERPSPHPVTVDWSNEIRYDVLVGYPDIRELLARQSAQAKKPLSGEEFLAAADKVIDMGIPMEQIARIAQPLATRLGIKTGKVRREVLPLPPGRVMVNILCSMARRGQSLKTVEQAQDGCTFEGTIPSDMWSLEGSLLVMVRREAHGTAVEATTRISGQLFDWGKSASILHDLFGDIPKLPV